ncbi:MAG: 50S ribosomal protein L5 [Candidatus Woesearchaeota archaeon]
MADTKDNIMRKIKIAKATLNVGAGKDQNVLNKGMMLIKHITGLDAVKTKTYKRLQAWGLRPGLPVGCKLTIRDPEMIRDLVERFLDAKNNELSLKQFDENGNVAFGIPEYIDIKGVKYNPDIGMMGLQICLTLERPGYRIKKRRIENRKVSHKHSVSKDDAIKFMKDNYNIIIQEESGEE